MQNEHDGWSEWSKYVLKELERLNTCYDALQKDTNEIKSSIRELQVKSGVWGFAAGLIPVLIMWAMKK